VVEERAQRASRNPEVLVVDHYDSYTWNLVHLIASVTGTLPEVDEHDQPGVLERARRSTHVVLSPGPGHPSVPADFALGAAVFDLGVPVLGVCLGMQALVTAYGGTVARVHPAHGEIAVVNHDQDGLFDGVPDPFEAVRYHSLAAVALPDVLRQTAVDEHSGVTMAVAHRDLPLVGVQFHPESILSQHGAALVRNFLS
jgi:anthranilate synthase/aminodeoxychorismate synthase-like glutamine amidotransferase